jgi:hypothetical protein
MTVIQLFSTSDFEGYGAFPVAVHAGIPSHDLAADT